MKKGRDMEETKFINLLKRCNQYHIADHFSALPPDKKKQFLENVKGMEIDLVLKLHDQFCAEKTSSGAIKNIQPAHIVTLQKTKEDKGYLQQALDMGESLIRNGKVAVLIVAGGQGSRLGHEGPKGMFPVSPVKNKPLFRLFAEQVRALSIRYNVEIPLLIMTSQENHLDTVTFFESHYFYGLSKGSVHFFQQNMLPSINPKGRLLLNDETHLLANPDGHGGSLKALHSSGLLKSLLDRGFEELFYCQVDNPLVKIADPLFLGCHRLACAEVSTKVVRRRNIAEKVGVYLSVNGKDAIIEYSDLDPVYMSALDENGEILYWAGNTAIHIFSLSFVERLTRHGFALPYHCARKVVEYPVKEKLVKKIDLWKFETFVFDAIPLAERTCCVEVKREEEFAPVKNREGVDSPERARAAMRSLHRSWLKEAGIEVPPEIQAEISPLFALDKEELADKMRGKALTIRDDIYLG